MNRDLFRRYSGARLAKYPTMDSKVAEAAGRKNEEALRDLNAADRPGGTALGGPRPGFGMHTLWGVLKEAAGRWSTDKVPRLGAALAYYTVFSLAPLLVIVITIAGIVFGPEAVQGYVIQQISDLMGPQAAGAIRDMLEKAQQPAHGVVAGAIAVVTLLIGASYVFGELQDALNTIWRVQPKPGGGIWTMIRDRFFSFIAVIGTAFLLLVSLVVSATLAAAGKFFGALLPVPAFVLEAGNLVVSFVVIAALFAMIYKLLPDVTIGWRDVWFGAIVTSLLFTIGKFLIGFYLGKSDIGSAYGAAGSFVILLVWVYYSSQIVLFGAELTAVYADRFGSRIRPTDNAVAA